MFKPPEDSFQDDITEVLEESPEASPEESPAPETKSSKKASATSGLLEEESSWLLEESEAEESPAPVTKSSKKASATSGLLEEESSRLLEESEAAPPLSQEEQKDTPEVPDHGTGSSDVIGLCDSVHQRLALQVLRKEVFKLVPEHVETRTLYNSKEPGIPQVGQCNSMCV